MAIDEMSTDQASGHGAEMLVRCDCGFETRGTEEDVVPVVQKHGVDAHNMTVTREQVLAMSQPA